MGVAGNYFAVDYTKPSMASANISVGGYEVRGVTKFSFKETVEAKPEYGNASTSQGAAAGKHSAEGSISMFTPSAAFLRQVLGGGFFTTFLTVSNSLFEPKGAGLLTYTATHVRLGALEMDNGEAGGSASATETFSLTIHDPIMWDSIPGIFLPGSLGLSLPIALPGISLSF